jgi:RHS repeat-associated protein
MACSSVARYGAYGRILSNTIPLTLTTRLYAWSDYDPETGLYKIGARWYDPQLGVWLTPDSIVPDVNNPIAWNPYAFNYQNPVQYVDPSGHIPIWDILDVGFFASSLVSFVAAPGLGTGFDLLLDTIDLLPGVTGFGKVDEVVGAVQAAGRVDDIGDARKVTIELGPGLSRNLEIIAQSRPNHLVGAVDIDFEVIDYLEELRSRGKLPSDVWLKLGDMFSPSVVPTGFADEVIAIAPHPSVLQDIHNPTLRIAKPRGSIYIATEMNITKYSWYQPMVSAFREQKAIIRQTKGGITGNNLLGNLELWSIHLTGTFWEIYIPPRIP